MSTQVGLGFTELTVAPSTAGPYWGHSVSSLQDGVEVDGCAVTGTLKYVGSGSLADTWGAGNFIALAFSDPDDSATVHRVGVRPSQGAGLVALDDDMDAVLKVTDKDAQHLVVESGDGHRRHRTMYALAGLTCEES